MGAGGFTLLDSDSSVATTTFSYIENQSDDTNAVLDVTCHDHGSGNSETHTITLKPGKWVVGTMTGVAITSGDVIAYYAIGEMPDPE